MSHRAVLIILSTFALNVFCDETDKMPINNLDYRIGWGVNDSIIRVFKAPIKSWYYGLYSETGNLIAQNNSLNYELIPGAAEDFETWFFTL